MYTREFPALNDDDKRFVDRLSVGLGRDVARVLAYLALGPEHPSADGPATRLEIRIGTEMSRGAVTDALTALERLDLVTSTSIRRHRRGRPPRAWTTNGDVTPRRVYELHARNLLDQVSEVADTCGRTTGARRVDEVESDSGSNPSRLRIGLNWRPNGLHAPLYVGAEGGYFADYDLGVELESNTGSSAALDALAAGDVDVALAGAATVVTVDPDGVRLVPLALLFGRAMAVLYTTRETFGESFERIEQLRDRRIGMLAGSETALLGRLLLSQVDTLSEAEIVELTDEEREALRSGAVDVVTGQVSDLQTLRDDGCTVDSLPVAEQFPLYGPTLVTTERILQERETDLHGFLTATMRGWIDAVERPGEAIKCVPVDPATHERERAVFERAVDEFAGSDEHGWGWHNESGWIRLRTALAQAGLLATDSE